MALKNAYSRMPINNILDGLQKILVKHGANQITWDYDSSGKVKGLMFTVKYGNQHIPIRVPAQVKEAAILLKQQGFKYDEDQTYRVVWRNIYDWVAAQMAFIDLGQVKLEQVFLPYVVDRSGQTFYDMVIQQKMLGSGED